MKMALVLTIFRKELLDMLRDKRTLVAMVAVPVLLYPALFVAGSQVALLQQDQLDRDVSEVAVLPEDNAVLVEWVEAIGQVVVVNVDDPVAALSDGRLDAVAAADAGFADAVERDGTASVTIRYDATEAISREAAYRVRRGLEDRAQRLLEARLDALGMDHAFGTPLLVEQTDVAPPEKTTGTILGMVLPIILVLMVGVGAFYPAIDLTAGEKERGTFETLLATPVSPPEIVFGKFLAVFCLSLFTGLLNLASMMVTVAFQLWQLEDRLGVFELELSPGTMVLIVLTLVPVAFLLSALMMSLAICTRSFREGQNLVTPFLLVLLFPAAYVAVPGAALTPTTALVPIANVALLFRDLMVGEGTAWGIGAVVSSTCAYAALALLLASRLFSSEEVVLSEDRGVPLTWRRSAFIRRTRPTPGIALSAVAISILLSFYLGSWWQGQHAILGLLATQWLLILAPTVALLWYVRVDLREALSLRVPAPAPTVAAIIVAGAWTVLAIQASVWQNRLLPMPEVLEEAMKRLFDPAATGVGVVGMVFAVAISPAICEEVLYRGALLSGLREKLPGWAVIVVVGLFFGMAHFSVHRAPVVVLGGIVLAYVVWRSGSLFLGMLVHGALNTFGVLAAMERLPEPVQEFLVSETVEQQGLPWWVVGVAVAGLAFGVLVMERWARRMGQWEMQNAKRTIEN